MVACIIHVHFLCHVHALGVFEFGSNANVMYLNVMVYLCVLLYVFYVARSCVRT